MFTLLEVWNQTLPCMGLFCVSLKAYSVSGGAYTTGNMLCTVEKKQHNRDLEWVDIQE